MTADTANETLSHVTPDGRPTMVDVSSKAVTRRSATACAEVFLPPTVAAAFDGDDAKTKKGPVLHTAIVAGTMAVKNTAGLIPFCHPLPIDSCDFSIRRNNDILTIECTVSVTGKTGVEMEALTGASAAALTAYDMLKALSHEIEIRAVRLLRKSGGKSDFDSEGLSL